MNIAFCALHENTSQCIEIGENLEELGNKIYYISDDAYTSNYLQSLNTLILSEVLSSGPTPDADLPFIISIYEKDRFAKLRYRLGDFIKIVSKWIERLEDFFVQHQIDCLILEGTPAFELVSEYVAVRLGIQIICPAQIFYRGQNYGVLYKDSCWSDAYDLNSIPKTFFDNEAEDANAIVFYEDISNSLVKRSLRFLRVRSLNSPTRRKQLLKILISFVSKFINDHRNKSMNGKDILFDYCFFLHMDPEKSVDNSGSDYWPQLRIIENFVSRFDEDDIILVRDHPHLGKKRSFKEVSLYKEVSKNLIFVFGDYRKEDIFAQAKGIATVSGTVAIEAARLGIPVLCYGRPLYLKHKNVFHESEFPDFILETRKKIDRVEVEKRNMDYEKELIPKLSNFVFGDVNLLSRALSEENNRVLAGEIDRLLRRGEP